ncbi:MAG: phosphotransferase [Planctomycetota bacterium]
MIERLAHLQPADGISRRLGLPSDALTLQRAWPRSAAHLLLEYIDRQGRIVGGQWFDEAGELHRIADETARRCPHAPPVVAESEHVLLQPRGADRRLIGLYPLLDRADATLVAHRPERRAVVRLSEPVRAQYAKVVRPSRVRDLIAPVRRLRGLPNRPFALPEEVQLDEPAGVVIWSALRGESLNDLLGDGDRLVPAVRAAGEALRWLHQTAPPGVKVHDARAETDMLTQQLERLRSLEPTVHVRLGEAPVAVFGALAGGSCGSSTIHRDFYDKQVFIDAEGRIGMLDFDTTAVGEPALDVANMLAHLELRAMQERCSWGLVSKAADALLAGYAPSSTVQARLGAYCDATRLRLACLYAYRPRWRNLTSELAGRIGAAPATAPAPRAR